MICCCDHFSSDGFSFPHLVIFWQLVAPTRQGNYTYVVLYDYLCGRRSQSTDARFYFLSYYFLGGDGEREKERETYSGIEWLLDFAMIPNTTVCRYSLFQTKYNNKFKFSKKTVHIHPLKRLEKGCGN